MAFSIAAIEPLSNGRQREHPRVGDVEGRELVHRRRRAVVVDQDLVEHRRVGPAGADGGEVVLRDGDGLLHLLLGFEEGVVDHVGLLRRFVVVVRWAGRHASGPMSVPIFSPWTARAMLPSSCMLKTTIGSRLSRHRLMAVASATLSPRPRNSS